MPGAEQNLDLAQAVRRLGWNVLTLHYRGSWGSPGRYSYVHLVEDGVAVVRFVQDPANAARYGVDPRRLVLAGHSSEGFVAPPPGPGDRGPGADLGRRRRRLRPDGEALANEVERLGGPRPQIVHMTTDHPYSDHRLALAETVAGWLERVAPSNNPLTPAEAEGPAKVSSAA